MRIPSHIEKVKRLTALRQRFDPFADFELWFWATLTAGTNTLNASLHRAGLTSDDPVFSSIPGVHMVRQPDGSYTRELRGLGDVSHVNWPPVEGAPEHIRRLEQTLEAIEQYRDPCVRGDETPTKSVIEDCERAFAEAFSIYTQTMDDARLA